MKIDDREIFEIKEWLNDDKQNVEGLKKLLNANSGGSSNGEG